MNRKKVVLGIDYNNVMIGGIYGTELINSHGNNVNGIRSFLIKLTFLIDSFHPDYVVLGIDMGREGTFRRKLYSGYKANRKPMPDDIRYQVDAGLTLLRTIGLPVIGDPLYEADDVLGMVSRLCIDSGMRMIICSSDNDYRQLLTDDVVIYDTRRQSFFRKEDIRGFYSLSSPSQLIDLKALAGDRSDNITGAVGIGPLTAISLLREFGSLEGIRTNIDSLSPKLQGIIRSNEKAIDLSRVLGTILTDYNLLGLTVNSLLDHGKRDEKAVRELLSELEIPSVVGTVMSRLLPLTDVKLPINQVPA